MKALILAAGYATRLYPYTKNFPKPLLPVNEKPIIEYLIEKLEIIESLSEIIIVTNARFFSYFQKWAKKLKTRKKIRIVNDLTRSPADRLGAIGDMRFVFNKIGFDHDYLVIGGDNFFQEPLTDFVARARRKTKAVTIGVCDIKKRSEARNYGVVKLDRGLRIVEFWEKPAKPQSSLVAMCLYYFPRPQVGLIKDYLKDPGNSSDAAGSYIGWLTKNKKVNGVIFRNYWVDIGHIHTYKMVSRITKNKGETVR
jgi:glucose-1-phosphate thymidylyltransferase